MSITWSTSELDMIKKQTLKDLRPSYYSVTNKNYIQISDDFEGYLILQAADDKQKLLTWIADISKINNDTKSQNELLARFLAVREEDANARIAELDEKLNKYSDMQATLITSGEDPARYAELIELSLMLKAITKSVDNILMQREQAFHELCVVKSVTNLLNVEKVSDEAEKEITSWQTIASTYRGQTSKSGSKVSKAATGGLF